MRLLVWQWGRRGAGPRFAAGLAEALRSLPGQDAALSLSAQAEILRGPGAPRCELPFATYEGAGQFARRLVQAPFLIGPLARRIAALRPDAALCAMPAALDAVMGAALRRQGVPYVVVVHDADSHPGDVVPLERFLQRRLVSGAAGIVALSDHVARRLEQQGALRRRRLLRATLPPFAFGAPPPPPGAHGGPLRLLCFGRLLPYKGLDLLAEALRRDLPPMQMRVVGSGPESPELDALRALPHVTVENRWVPEGEVGALLAWADALVLSHREASQSGVAAAAIAAGRWLAATRVGGLAEQLQDQDGALLCDPTPEGLAAALARLATDPPPPPVPPDPMPAWQDVAAKLVRQVAVVTQARSAG